MGRRAKEENHLLKPESFIIWQDENGQKYATLSFKECTKKHKDAGEKTKSLQGFMFAMEFRGVLSLDLKNTFPYCRPIHQPFICTQGGQITQRMNDAYYDHLLSIASNKFLLQCS